MVKCKIPSHLRGSKPHALNESTRRVNINSQIDNKHQLAYPAQTSTRFHRCPTKTKHPTIFYPCPLVFLSIFYHAIGEITSFTCRPPPTFSISADFFRSRLNTCALVLSLSHPDPLVLSPESFGKRGCKGETYENILQATTPRK